LKYLIGFIGFGEAAFHIANGLKSEGLNEIIAYDINQDHQKIGKIVRRRAEEADILLVDSLEILYRSSRIIMSLTSSKVAFKLADQVIPNLAPGQIYADMNSTAPEIMQSIDRIPRKSGVGFCDAAIMSTVPGSNHKVEIFLSGDGAADLMEVLMPYGMNLRDLNALAGGSSAIKMLRSVVMKGLPQLMMEAMLPALEFGTLDALIDSLNGSLKGKSVEDLANIFFARTIVHAQRRSKEMKDFIATIEALGMDATMSRATCDNLQALDSLNLVDRIGPEGDLDFRRTLQVINERRKG